MKKLWFIMVFVGVLIFGMGGMAGAVSFDIGPNGLSGNHWTLGSGWGTGNGQLDAVFSLSGALPSVAFDLNGGQSSTFLFGSIQFREGDIGGTETDNLLVTAYLNFLLPPVGAEPNTSTVAAIQGDAHDAQDGYWTWKWSPQQHQWIHDVWVPPVPEATDLSIIFNPTLVTFSGGTFTIQLSNVIFDDNQTKDVYATVTLNSSVPEPLSMLLLGSGLIGLWGLRRRMKK